MVVVPLSQGWNEARITRGNDIPPCSEGKIVLFTSFVSREIFLQMEFAVRMTCSTCEEDVGKALRGVGGR